MRPIGERDTVAKFRPKLQVFQGRVRLLPRFENLRTRADFLYALPFPPSLSLSSLSPFLSPALLRIRLASVKTLCDLRRRLRHPKPLLFHSKYFYYTLHPFLVEYR